MKFREGSVSALLHNAREHKEPSKFYQKGVVSGTMSIMCAGKCGLSYTACLEKRHCNLKEDKAELQKLSQRNYKGFFTKGSRERIAANLRHEYMSNAFLHLS